MVVNEFFCLFCFVFSSYSVECVRVEYHNNVDISMRKGACVCVCVCACVRACVRACVCANVFAYV